MRTSKAFSLARAKIRSGMEDYICLALDNSKARQIVQKRMQMPRFKQWVAKNYHYDASNDTLIETSLDWWLVWKKHVKPSAMPTRKQMRTYRVQWLTALIKEFEQRGD